MKIYTSRNRLVEKIDFNLSELDDSVHNLMFNHHELDENTEAVLLSTIYSKISDIAELFEIYKERNGYGDE